MRFIFTIFFLSFVLFSKSQAETITPLEKAKIVLTKAWENRDNVTSPELKSRLNEVYRVVESGPDYSNTYNDYSCSINLSGFVSKFRYQDGYSASDRHGDWYYDYYFPVWGNCPTQKSFHISCWVHYDCTATSSNNPRFPDCKLEENF